MNAPSSIDPQGSILNIAAYRFVPLSDLANLRQSLLSELKRLEIKGTILLSPEGINMFLAGGESGIRHFLDYIDRYPELRGLEVKESYCDRAPFNRTLVRLKREIIAFGVDDVDPIRETSPKIAPEVLRQWLDEGRDVTLLDVRNNYEVELGTFRDAVAIDIDNFRDFPDAVERLPDEAKEKPLVMFCTGGIRCEKAGPLMEQRGFQQVYQLGGGILKYFEDIGGDHYDGDCFVFDQRVSVDSSLRETETTLCYVCQATLDLPDQQSQQYVPGKSCPHCYDAPTQRMAQLIQQRNLTIEELTNPLPGSTPQDNVRPISVSLKSEGMQLIDLLDRAHPHVGRDRWQQRCEDGLLLLGGQPVGATQTVSVGQRYQHVIPREVEPDINPSITILHEDDSMIVVDKPAPLPMHPSGRFNRNSLTSILNRVYGQPLKIAHRLDANTTGVVILSRSKAVARVLQPQFESGAVDKTYLARVSGQIDQQEFQCDASISKVPTQAGLRVVDETGLSAETHFRVVKRFADGTSLLQVKPLTGRTNQIRVHLWHLGLPIMGDPAYLPFGELGRSQTLSPVDPPMCLHAWKIRFTPFDGTGQMEMLAPEPHWCQEP